jgi:acyl carrier protein
VTEKIEILREYIRSEIGYQGHIDPDVDLLEERVLDSYSIVQIAVFIQQRFEVDLDAEDLVRANLCRLSAMVAMVERKLAA